MRWLRGFLLSSMKCWCMLQYFKLHLSFIMQHQVLRGSNLFPMCICRGGCSGLSLAICSFQGISRVIEK